MNCELTSYEFLKQLCCLNCTHINYKDTSQFNVWTVYAVYAYFYYHELDSSLDSSLSGVYNTNLLIWTFKYKN